MKTEIKYTKYYCEENIYHFLKDYPTEEIEEAYAIFISSIDSPTKINNHNFKNFDYHVIAMIKYKKDDTYYIWDLDSKRGFKVPVIEYLAAHFGGTGATPRLRMVPKEIMIDNFKTDRSHMTNNKAKVPEWDKLHDTSNLKDYTNLTLDIEGTTIVDFATFLLHYIADKKT